MDEYSEQTRLLCKYNITTLSELNACKNDFKGELQALINERKKLYYTRDKLPENQNKEEILKDIITIGEKITKVRRNVKLCDNIEKQSLEKLEQIKIFEEKQKQEKEQKKSKKKEKNMKDNTGTEMCQKIFNKCNKKYCKKNKCLIICIEENKL